MSSNLVDIDLEKKIEVKRHLLNPTGYFENFQVDLPRYIPSIEPQWIYGLINIEEATSFQFAVLEDL
jgi:hypothetical protein